MHADPQRLLFEIASDMRANSDLLDVVVADQSVRSLLRQQGQAIAAVAEIVAYDRAQSTRHPQAALDELTAEQFGIRAHTREP